MPKRSSRPVSFRPGLMARALLCALMLGSCTQVSPEPLDARPSAPSSSETPTICEASGVRCGQAGPRGVTWALLPHGGKTDAPPPLVLVEMGGPGLALDSVTDVVAALDLTRYDVLVVAEPWTRAAISSACLRAEAARLDQFGSKLSGGPSSDCPTAASSWWQPGEYVATLLAVEGALERRIDAAVGLSFGATLAAQAGSLRSGLPVVLIAPAPPEGTPLADVHSTRAAAIQRAADSAAPGLLGRLLAAGEAADGRDQRGDAVLSLAAASSDEADLKGLVDQLQTTGASEEVRRRAFAASYRYGAGAMLPNFIGYRMGVCATYPTSSAADPGSGTLTAALGWIDACEPGAAALSGAATTDLTGCLVANRRDLVTPASFAELWRSVAPRMGLVDDDGPRHLELTAKGRSVLAALPASALSCGRS